MTYPIIMVLKITSLNAKGLNSPFKLAMLCKEALSQQRKMLCIQEMHFSKSKASKCSNPKFAYYFLQMLNPKNPYS